jgi:hypothetical protein
MFNTAKPLSILLKGLRKINDECRKIMNVGKLFIFELFENFIKIITTGQSFLSNYEL